MRGYRKATAVVLIAIVAATSFGTGAGEAGDSQESIELKAMLLGPGRQQDSQLVWDQFNEQLQAFVPGATVEFEVITASEYRERWQLTMAANETIDLAWRGWMLSLDAEVDKGAYMPLDDLMAEHGAEIKEALPSWLLDMGRKDGVLYEIPMYQQVAIRRALWTRRELAEQYMDIDAFRETLLASDVVTDDWLAAIESYLRALQDAGELGLGINVPFFEEQGYEIFANPYAYRLDDPNMTVVNIWETPRHRQTLDRLATWFRDGLIRQDALSVQNIDQDNFREDGYIMWMDQIFQGNEEARSADMGIDLIAFPFAPYYWIRSGRTPTNMTIPRTAAHPEEAMQVLELLNTAAGAEVYNTLVYGIDGVHYSRVGDNRIETIDYVGSASAESRYGLPKWATGNTFNAYLTQAEQDGWNEYIENVVHGERARVSEIMGFVVDRTPIEDQLSLVDSLRREYIRLYAVEDYEAVYEEYMERLELAGNEAIKAEFQRQIDAYRAANQ